MGNLFPFHSSISIVHFIVQIFDYVKRRRNIQFPFSAQLSCALSGKIVSIVQIVQSVKSSVTSIDGGVIIIYSSVADARW